jgi:hypothetical protein
MLRYTAIGLAALSLSLAALTPVRADIPGCMKQPNADTCPTMGVQTPTNVPGQGTHWSPRHSRYHATHAPYKG